MIRTLICFLLALSTAAQDLRPVSFHKAVKQAEGEHFRYIYDADVASFMPRVHSYCEAAHKIFAEALNHRLSEKPVILVSDRIDSLSGSVQVAPHLTMSLSVNQSTSGFEGLLSQGDMLWLLVVHEMAHIFTLDQGGKTKQEIASLFGRVPLDGDVGVPTLLLSLLTNARTTLTPTWYPEGWATWAETRYTEGGRGRSAFFDAIWRQKVIAGELPGNRDIGVTPRDWPGGIQPYSLGQEIFDHLDQSSKADARSLPAQVNEEGGKKLLFLNRSSEPVTGKTVNQIAADGLRAVAGRQRENIVTLREQAVTKTPRYSPRNWILNSPAQLPDGRLVMNATPFDNRRPSLVVFEPRMASGQAVWTRWGDARTDRSSAVAAHPDGHVYYTRLEPRGTGERYRSLYRRSARGSVRRVATSARFEHIAIDPAGLYLVAVRSSRKGGAMLVQHPIESDGTLGQGEVRYRTPPMHRLGRVSVSQKGDILVAEIGTSQSWIVRLGLDGGITEHVTGVRGMLVDPVVDPATGDIVAAWDNGGVFNLYRFAPGSIKPTRISHTLGALLSPQVAKDGRIFALNLDEDGVYLTGMNDLQAITNNMPNIRVERPEAVGAPGELLQPPLDSGSYNGATAMRFDYWVPVAEASTDGASVGLAAHFSDPAQFHHLDLLGGYDTGIEEPIGRLRYRFDGMRAGLTLEAERSTSLFTDLVPRQRDGESLGLDDYEEVRSGGRIGLDWLFPRADSAALLEIGMQASDREAASNTLDLDDADFTDFFEGLDTRAYGALSFDSTTSFAKSHSRENGRIIHLGGDVSSDETGGDLNRQRGFASWREYISMPWSDHQVLVLHGAAGIASGDEIRQGSFGLGGVPLLGDELANPIVSGQLGSPLRGYGYNAQVGSELQVVGAAWRFPIYRSFRSGSPTSLLGFSQLSGEAFYDVARAWFDRDSDGEWISSTGAQLNVGLLLLGEFEIVPSVGVAYAPDQDSIRPVDDGDDEDVNVFFSLRAGAAY